MTLPQEFKALIEKAKQKLGLTRATQIEADASRLKTTQAKVEHVAKMIGERPPASRLATAQPTQADVFELRHKLAAAQAEILTLKAELEKATEQNEQQISRKALEICASQGNVPPFATRPSRNPATGTGKEALWQQYHSLPIAERNQFYKDHRNDLREY